MARPRGPEKKLIALRVTLPTYERLQRKTGGKKGQTYLAGTVEQQAPNSLKAVTKPVPSPRLHSAGNRLSCHRARLLAAPHWQRDRQLISARHVMGREIGDGPCKPVDV
jgi:hypothetical protein